MYSILYTTPSIKCRRSKAASVTFSFVKTGLNKRKCYAGCLDLRHFILGGVYKELIYDFDDTYIASRSQQLLRSKDGF
jgi:hypothetical protein